LLTFNHLSLGSTAVTKDEKQKLAGVLADLAYLVETRADGSDYQADIEKARAWIERLLAEARDVKSAP